MRRTDVRDEMEFTEAESNLADLCNEYDQCERLLFGQVHN